MLIFKLLDIGFFLTLIFNILAINVNDDLFNPIHGLKQFSKSL
jgi:hypothetical protein